MTNQIHCKELMAGAIVGSLLGSVSALLLAPKAGRDLREDICEACEDFSERGHDFAERGRSFARSLGSQPQQWSCKARQAVEEARRTVKGLVGCKVEEEHSVNSYLIGGVAGAVAGAVIGLALAPKRGDEFRKDLMKTYENASGRSNAFVNDMARQGKAYAKRSQLQANKWLDLARDLVEDLTDEVQNKSDEYADKAKSIINHERIHDVIDWATLGYKLWQHLQTKR